MIPTETDLNALPLLSSVPERVLPIAATQSRTNEGSNHFHFLEYFIQVSLHALDQCEIHGHACRWLYNTEKTFHE